MGCWTSLRGRATCYPVLVVLVCLALGQHFHVHGCGHSFYHDQAVATVQDYLHYKPLTEQAVGKVTEPVPHPSHCSSDVFDADQL